MALSSVAVCDLLLISMQSRTEHNYIGPQVISYSLNVDTILLRVSGFLSYRQ